MPVHRAVESERGPVVYPAIELRTAWVAARYDGVDVCHPDAGYHECVRVLERLGYLPRDRARVERLVAAATAAAERAHAARERERAHAAAVRDGVVVDLAARRAGRGTDRPPAGDTVPA